MPIVFSKNRQDLLQILKVGAVISEKETAKSTDLEQKSTVFWRFTDNKCEMLFATEKFTFVVCGVSFITMKGQTAIPSFGINTHKLYKLLSNSTTENVKFTLTETELIVETNGVFHFPLVNSDSIVFNFPQNIYAKGKLIPNFNLFVSNFVKLRDFTDNDSVNPANSGVYIDTTMITAHTNYYGAIFQLQAGIDPAISFDPDFYTPLAKLTDLDDVQVITSENHIVIKGYIGEVFYYLEGRVLDGTFNKTYIEKLSLLLDNIGKGEITTVNIEKDTWYKVYSRIEPFVDEAVVLAFNGEQMQLRSPSGSAEEFVEFPIEGLIEPFNLQVRAVDLQKFFKLSNNLFLSFTPIYDKTYHVVCIEAVSFVEDKDETIAVGFICRFDE